MPADSIYMRALEKTSTVHQHTIALWERILIKSSLDISFNEETIRQSWIGIARHQTTYAGKVYFFTPRNDVLGDTVIDSYVFNIGGLIIELG